MEIGIADGENAKNMIKTAKENVSASEIEYYGFDVFSRSRHKEPDPKLHQVQLKLQKMGCQFTLFKGDSTETLTKYGDQLPTMDLIFIDGGHDYAVVKSDWHHAKQLMGPNSVAFFHNANWQGPRRVITNISREKFTVKQLDPPSDSSMAEVRLRGTNEH